MNRRNERVCCLGLLNEKVLEGVVGVGVLLQSISDPLSDDGAVLSYEDVRFDLNSRSRQQKKPWMNLVGSVVLVADGEVRRNGQRSKCVGVEFWWLKPWMARVFSENCLNEMSWSVIRKLDGVSKKEKFQNCQKQHSLRAKRAFEIWYLSGADSLYFSKNLNDSTGVEGSDLRKGETASETSDRESDSAEIECEIRYGFTDSESKDHNCDLKAADLWTEARSIAFQISMLKNESIKHFGYLVPSDEIGWVKAGYYRSLPKAYKKKLKNQEKKSRRYFADHLEEKARRNAWFRVLWHPLTRLLLVCYFGLIALVLFRIRVDRLNTILEDRFDDLTSVGAGLFALLIIVFLFTLLSWQILKRVKIFFFRKHIDASRKRRLKEWQDDNK